MDSGKYRLCLRLSVFDPGRLDVDSLSAKGNLLETWVAVAVAGARVKGTGTTCECLHVGTLIVGCPTPGIKMS
jgi:hypothetical protein